MRRALAIDEASYGPDHPDVAIHLNNLASLLQATNRLAEAEPMYRRALAIDEASYGPDHPNVATASTTSPHCSPTRTAYGASFISARARDRRGELWAGSSHVATDLNNLATFAPRHEPPRGGRALDAQGL